MCLLSFSHCHIELSFSGSHNITLDNGWMFECLLFLWQPPWVFVCCLSLTATLLSPWVFICCLSLIATICGHLECLFVISDSHWVFVCCLSLTAIELSFSDSHWVCPQPYYCHMLLSFSDSSAYWNRGGVSRAEDHHGNRKTEKGQGSPLGNIDRRCVHVCCQWFSISA